MSLTLVISGEECFLTLGDQVGRMPLTLVVSGKNVPYIGGSVGRMPLTLVISGKNVPYIGGHWEECSLHW
ncbi:unnamed protein product [Staurois parvus]|uniref:Uncharacterized protein n=1 Tax=Staurois parvus TaxID=386267 RepID=A0ABN9B930_9NEOB|nr:unnamed protein product [Staurois parvus]